MWGSGHIDFLSPGPHVMPLKPWMIKKRYIYNGTLLSCKKEQNSIILEIWDNGYHRYKQSLYKNKDEVTLYSVKTIENIYHKIE